jgi:hypothetical protein
MDYIKITAQIIGVIAFMLSAISFQAKSFKMINVLKIISQILFTIQYLMLGAFTAMLMNMFSFLRGFVYIALENKNKSTQWAQLGFSITFIAMGIITWDGWIGVFAILGTVLQTIAFGNKNPAKIRIINLPTCFMWMVYNWHYRSVGGLLSDVFSFVSIIIGIIRLDIPEIKSKFKKKV